MVWLRFYLPEVQIQLVSLPHTLTLTWDMVGKKGGLAHGRETCVLSLIQNNPLLWIIDFWYSYMGGGPWEHLALTKDIPPG